jgi:hypothetical protein
MNSFEQVDAELAVHAKPIDILLPSMRKMAISAMAKDFPVGGRPCKRTRYIVPFRGGAPQVLSGKTASSAGRNEGDFRTPCVPP